MIQNILTGIENVSVYGVTSICIFFGFFTGMLVWAFLRKKNYLNHMAELPLDSGEKNSTDKNPSSNL
jgi:cbb3-type cytochrome oxidase subunit 3